MSNTNKKHLLVAFTRELQYFRQLSKDVKFLNNQIIQPKKKSLKRDITDIKNALHAEKIQERKKNGLPRLGRPPRDAKIIQDNVEQKVESKKEKKSKEMTHQTKLLDMPSVKSGRGSKKSVQGLIAAYSSGNMPPNKLHLKEEPKPTKS